MSHVKESSLFAAGHGKGSDWRIACEEALRRLGEVPAGANVGFVYFTDHLAHDAGEIVERFAKATGIDAWMGTVGLGVCATGAEYFDEPAVAVMLGALDQDQFRLFATDPAVSAEAADELTVWFGNRRDEPFAEPPVAIIHADPRSADAISGIATIAERTGAFLAGGLPASRSIYPQVVGGARGLYEGTISGLALRSGGAVVCGLTQGCTPVGPAHEITSAEENTLVELDGRPALDVLKDDIGDLLARDLRRTANYIYAALPVSGVDTGDYLVRNIMGYDVGRGLVGIAAPVAAGEKVLFCRRDAASAVTDLERMLGQVGKAASRNGGARGALYFSCVARGPNMFGPQMRELDIIRAKLGDIPLAGFFGNGEISASRLYSYTGVLVVFTG